MITMKRKGFTLIELLAVIVVLAIIALIATPTILGVIEKARRGAAEQSALGYIDALEMQVSLNSLDLEKEDIKDGVYTVSQLKKLEVSIKGQSPSDESWVKVKNGRVVAYSLKFGRYTITLDENNNKVIEKDGEVIKKPDDNTTNPDNPDDNKKYTVYNNGTAIYYNPETNEICDKNEVISTTGTKTGCMKWYTFNDEGEDSSTVNMILDHNTTAYVYAQIGYSYTSKEKLEEAISNDTSTWQSSLKARLITADEIAKITGNTKFNSSISTTNDWFYLDSNNQTRTATSQGASKYAWLFDYTSGCTSYGCNIKDTTFNNDSMGYWTISPALIKSNSDHEWYWYIFREGKLQANSYASNFSGTVCTYASGIRPVITVSKKIIGKKLDKTYSVYRDGTAIYFNPETNSKCNDYTEENSRYYNKTGCMKWYTFNDEGEKSSIVNMILDHSTSYKAYWNSEANQSEPKEAIFSLKNDTSTWNSILKVRLITVDEIAKITGNTNFNSSTSTYKQWFYLDSNNQTQTAKGQGTSKYAWLYDYTDGCTNYGCSIEFKNSNAGYWTSTPVFDYSTVTGVSTYAWWVGSNGSIYYGNGYYGVRPVITVLKNKIS